MTGAGDVYGRLRGLYEGTQRIGSRLGMDRVRMRGERERATQVLRDVGLERSCFGSRDWEEEDRHSSCGKEEHETRR